MSSDRDITGPRVSNILLSSAAASMDFWANGMHVTGGGYDFVWYAIAEGWMSLRIARKGDSEPAAVLVTSGTAVAVYQDRIFWFADGNPLTSPKDRSAVVHESTHALRAIMLSGVYAKDGLYGSSIQGQYQADNECVAYIAGALFYLYDNNGTELPAGSPSIHATANDIAKKIYNRRGAYVDSVDYTILRGDITTDPTYLKLWGGNIAAPDAARKGVIGRPSG